MAEKISIISHCNDQQNKLKWELLNSNYGQFLCANHTGQIMATYGIQDFNSNNVEDRRDSRNIIELWDTSASPICMSYLRVLKGEAFCYMYFV
jgi:hypothetical protein